MQAMRAHHVWEAVRDEIRADIGQRLGLSGWEHSVEVSVPAADCCGPASAELDRLDDLSRQAIATGRELARAVAVVRKRLDARKAEAVAREAGLLAVGGAG